MGTPEEHAREERDALRAEVGELRKLVEGMPSAFQAMIEAATKPKPPETPPGDPGEHVIEP